MYNLNEIPSPPYSHYVGLIYSYEIDETLHFMALKDQDKKENRLNIKLPGGTNERVYEEYIMYENALFKMMENLKFEKAALRKIYKNERKREEIFKEYDDPSMIFILRTLVMECMKKTGYYPMDLEPQAAFFVEKEAHTQYFLEVKHLIDGKAEDVLKPDQTDGFKPLDLGVKETRVPVEVNDFRTMIFSHRTAIEKYLTLTGRAIPPSPMDMEADEED